jgi:hypothetical protein
VQQTACIASMQNYCIVRPFYRDKELWHPPMEQKAELRLQIRISSGKQCGFRNKKDMVLAWKTLMKSGKSGFYTALKIR